MSNLPSHVVLKAPPKDFLTGSVHKNDPIHEDHVNGPC